MTEEEPKPLCAPSYLTDDQEQAMDELVEQAQELGLYETDMYKFHFEAEHSENNSFKEKVTDLE